MKTLLINNPRIVIITSVYNYETMIITIYVLENT